MNFRDGAIAVAIAFISFLLASPAAAQGVPGVFPIPPCAGEPSPAYPAPGPMPDVQVWRDAELNGVRFPACVEFGTLAPNSLIATAGRFESESGVAAIAGRLARISALTAIRYYSVRDSRWKQLFVDAYALGDAPRPGTSEARRVDFSADDLVTGHTLRFSQEENAILSPVIYRLSVIERTQDRLIYTIVNESAAKALLFSASEPGDIRQYYVIEREAGNLWRFYSLAAARIWTGPFSLPTQSFINRAIAYYRHISGFPTEQEFRQSP